MLMEAKTSAGQENGVKPKSGTDEPPSDLAVGGSRGVRRVVPPLTLVDGDNTGPREPPQAFNPGHVPNLRVSSRNARVFKQELLARLIQVLTYIAVEAALCFFSSKRIARGRLKSTSTAIVDVPIAE